MASARGLAVAVASRPLSWCRWEDVRRAMFVASLYAGFATAAYRLSHHYSLGVSLFPAAGVSLAGLLLSPRRSWPWIASFVAAVEMGLDLFHGSGPLLAATFALGNTVEPLMSAFIIGRICGEDFSLQRVKDILALTFASCFSPMVSATIAATGASIAGLADFRTWWFMWWSGDVVGGLAVVAALVAWRSQNARPKLRPRAVACLWGGGVVATVAFLLGGDRVPIAFLVAPVLIAIAVRAGAVGVGLAGLGLAALGEYSAWSHTGPLANGYSRSATVSLTQAFVGASLFTMLVLNAASAQGAKLEVQARERESIGEVAREVAHDINHLLSLIMANCELLSMQVDVSGSQWDALERIVQGAERTSKIVQQLQIVASPCDRVGRSDLNVIVRSMEPLLRTAAGKSMLKLSLASLPCEVRVGASDVEQVLLNLVLNAREATDQEGSIIISTDSHRIGERGGWRAILTVADDGHGMDEQVIMRAFDAWFSNATDRRHGVGIPRVRAIVENHGGTMDIKSRLGSGTAVRASWPLDTSPLATGATTPEKEMPVVVDAATSPTLLVAASDPQLRAMVVHTLSERGYRLAVVTDPAGTMSRSRSLERVDAAIIQAGLLGLNGIALANRLVVERPQLPIVLLGDLSGLPGRSLPDGASWIPVPPDERVLLRWVEAAAPILIPRAPVPRLHPTASGSGE